MFLTRRGPQKSIPVAEYGNSPLTLNAGSGAVGRVFNAFDSDLLQIMHYLITRLTVRLPWGTQYLDLNSLRVSLTLLCLTIS